MLRASLAFLGYENSGKCTHFGILIYLPIINTEQIDKFEKKLNEESLKTPKALLRLQRRFVVDTIFSLITFHKLTRTIINSKRKTWE